MALCLQTIRAGGLGARLFWRNTWNRVDIAILISAIVALVGVWRFLHGKGDYAGGRRFRMESSCRCRNSLKGSEHQGARHLGHCQAVFCGKLEVPLW